ncbi:ciliogenesis and planar polarity effector 2-like [Tigriopus californicus]|uniref:ciliogenesis and planar polarity effector 2-like n=1 Tax=Tigriopus californicus TaxID=6832 RepID=UPI0027D9F1C0|nr:ciliogenesis and planar polarity effector 2-like [Tigriopus californicus]XP_059081927.1 ciliogenesis and planar polarity effector 2-like [Tigriopus californicus]
MRSHAISLDWHHTPEGQGVLTHLTDQTTGERRIYGYLERPILPPTVQVVHYKLFLSGKAGIGKSSLVSFLLGQAHWTSHLGETPGIKVTNVFWPTKIQTQLVLFHLSLWDAGETASKKYSHIQPVCQENSTGVIFVFAFNDRRSFEELDQQIPNLSQAPTQICPIVVGTKYGSVSESEITQPDVVRFETRWKLPVLRIRHQTPQAASTPNQGEVAIVLNLICDQLWCHQTTRFDSNLP